MRFLLVSHHAPPHIGGVENLVLAEAQALLAAGHDVVWVTSDGDGDGAPPPPHPRFRLIRIRAWHAPERWFGIAFPLFAPTLLTRLWREVAAADVVHVHGLVFLGSPIATVLARLHGKWSLCTDHGGLQRYRFSAGTLLLRVLFATAGRVTAHAANRLIAYNRDIEALLRRLGGDADKVAFVANPVDAGFRPPTADERAAARRSLGWDDVPRVLCVSRLLPHKGIDVLLAAQHPSYRVVFCGPGTAAMQQHIRERGGECLAPRARCELLTVYHAAAVFALPSHNEGFPVAVQEALACGLPVLTSDLPAYAPYRELPELHLCAPEPDVVRSRLLALLASPRTVTAPRAPRDANTLASLCDTAPPGAPRDENTLASSRDIAPPSAPHDANANATDAAATWLQQLCVGAPPQPLRRSRWLAICIALLLALHLAFALARWPAGAVGKRAESIAQLRSLGDVDWYLRHYDDETRRIVHWLRESVAADQFVRFEGFRQGALQFVAPLLFPRLLVDVEGKELATLRAPTGKRAFDGLPPWLPSATAQRPVLLAYPDRLRVELR